MLPILHARHEFPLSGPITLRLIGDDHPWNVRASLEQLAEVPFGRSLIATGLDQDIVNMAIRIDRSPPIVPLPINREKDLIEMLLVARPRPSMPERIRIGLTNLAAPLPDGFVGHRDAAGKQQLFHIAIAEAEPKIQPNYVADDLGWKAVILIGVDR